ncbi:MAG: hypothetical protein A3C12_02165 [Candidatus Sungbacteria bacterium RIFCSPHIGHO2_02_FULL_49_20]|uniref:Uncharacterized protein n=1 Tax=Candidatus Sungbacteria bacterium RIFCSPHIGHO2_02_FULL_49_20 TaxID=1802272 RepID=A0A1G2KRM7_9BACT|nr:MAG: hypothetical protein A3C12_02165 [Candidatus Sungbacteria bacterium RIFCSPHIGHO2_02_FULL_49_20]
MSLRLERGERTMKYNVPRLQQFFFEGSLRGYAGGGEKIIVSGVKKTRRFVHQRGELYYRDEYVVNGEYSGGSTIIYVDSFPVWLMQYYGWCKNDDSAVLAFLKEILADTYRSGEFAGGRGRYGLWSSDDGTLGYENTPGLSPSLSEFTDFMGHERIYRNPGPGKHLHEGVVFWHRYQGILLGEPE